MITTPIRCRLLNYIQSSAEARRATYAELAHQTGITASERTIARALHQQGFYRCIAVRKPFLSESAKQKRLDWCLARAHWDEAEWAQVCWTDEAAMHVGGPRRTWVTRLPGEQHKTDCLQPKFAHLEHCMIWGAISHNSKSDLVFWDKRAWGNINADSYQRHILPTLRDFHDLLSFTAPIEAPDSLVMQDNAPPHKAKTTIAWFEREQIPLLEWPASSPDLNPIENVWSMMKERINRRTPRPNTLDAMKIAIAEEWAAVMAAEIAHLVSSMSRRVQAVIMAQGGPIDY